MPCKSQESFCTKTWGTQKKCAIQKPPFFFNSTHTHMRAHICASKKQNNHKRKKKKKKREVKSQHKSTHLLSWKKKKKRQTCFFYGCTKDWACLVDSLWLSACLVGSWPFLIKPVPCFKLYFSAEQQVSETLSCQDFSIKRKKAGIYLHAHDVHHTTTHIRHKHVHNWRFGGSDT